MYGITRSIHTDKKKFAIGEDIQAKGLAHIAIDALFKSKHVQNNNYNSLELKGNSVFANLLVNIPKDTIYSQTEKTELVFGRIAEAGSRKAFGKINITNLKLNYKNQEDLTLAGLVMKLKSIKLKYST